MTPSSLATIVYDGQDRQVAWRGLNMVDGDGFDGFMAGDVAARLHDREGAVVFETHLRGLAGTGFARDSLHAILVAEIPEERDWAVGEAVAEAYLGRECAIIWPWNMSRDKRNPVASMPGADLVGFEAHGDKVRLALGEVKTSSDACSPPGVMNGRSGMSHQIDNLATRLSLVCQLLKWLLPRCKSTEYEALFNGAIAAYLDSGNRDVALFGVLVRDTTPTELDLQARGRQLAGSLCDPTTCQLIAIYIPCAISALPARVSGGGS
jgi:hypothetical protein